MRLTPLQTGSKSFLDASPLMLQYAHLVKAPVFFAYPSNIAEMSFLQKTHSFVAFDGRDIEIENDEIDAMES